MSVLQEIYSFVRCPMYHAWKLVRASEIEVEMQCARCHKTSKRTFSRAA